MDDLLNEFLTETNEAIAVLDVELVRLEQNPNDPGLLANIFRLVHTIKGTCGFLGLPRLEKVAHAGENVLGKFRDGEMLVDEISVSLILESLDRIKELVSVLETTEAEPEGDDSDLIKRLNALADGGAAAVAQAGSLAPAAVSGEMTEDELEAAFLAAPGPDDAPAESAEAAAPSEAEPAEAEIEGPRAPRIAEPAEAAPLAESAIANQTIRVHVEFLEDLMNMGSELVLTRNQLMQMVRGRGDSDFAVPLQRLSHVTTDMQEGVMQTRMQPIGNAWAKLPRIVRDVAKDLNKRINLDMQGAETELDRQVLELIKDPLTHMVRNSGDHGLETPAERRDAGKPETGRITLKAFHEGGHIIIQIADDGRGLPVDKIREKAISSGIASAAEIEGMSEQRILQLIFQPGLSTATAVTNVSGRGVGMDVVRTNIEKIGGTIELESRVGKGTTFTIKIPLTLAIVSALIVECAGERFAIPQLNVVELVGVSEESEHKIESVSDTPVLRLRNRLLPLVPLREVLNAGPVSVEETDRDANAEAKTAGKDVFIVVSQVGSYTFGIVVDKVFDTEEIVVKPVAPMLRDLSIYSGNTILGDGSVIMILDPNGIADSTGERAVADRDAEVDERGERVRGEEKTSLLVFRAGGPEPKAVPLSLISRLEEIDIDTIEASDGRLVVQYRDRLMPLVKAQDGMALKEEGRQPILVFTDADKSMGLIVDEIVDIVEEVLKVELAAQRPGIIGSAVVGGAATEIIDTGHYLTMAHEDWFSVNDNRPFGDDHAGRRVLLVDDSPFFREMLTPLLTTAGYAVTAAGDADSALKLREDGVNFDVIISDIEMPGMDGFEFAKAVSSDSRWQHTPMVALSSHATPADMDRGRAVGFADYIAKMDREGLLSSLSQMIETRSAA